MSCNIGTEMSTLLLQRGEVRTVTVKKTEYQVYL